MSNIYITEYARQPRDAEGKLVPVGDEPALATQKVASGSGSSQSSAFNAKTNFVRIHADAIVSIAIGADPTATTSTTRMAADQTEFFGVQPGHKVAVIDNT